MAKEVGVGLDWGAGCWGIRLGGLLLRRIPGLGGVSLVRFGAASAQVCLSRCAGVSKQVGAARIGGAPGMLVEQGPDPQDHGC